MQEAAADPLIGHLLEGRYRIHAFLAVGGMSTVYAGIDERLDREVAVKVMAPSLSADPVFLDRFAREARSAARLSHVNAVAVYDQGRDGSRVFLVMELVRGRTLRDLLRERGHLSPAEAVSLMEQILAALAAAHRAGLVHRDVKPENILLSDDGVVKVADFGLARAVEGDPRAANTGLIMGTVAYSAPEQFRRGRADMHSDVYSAGVVLFELLTGRQPHVGPDAMAVAYNHVHVDVPPPSAFQPGIAPALDHLVARVTARDPQFRPQDAGAFLAQLHDVRRELRLPVLPVPRRPRPDGRAAVQRPDSGGAGGDDPATYAAPRPPAGRPVARRPGQGGATAATAAVPTTASPRTASTTTAAWIGGRPTTATAARGTPPAAGSAAHYATTVQPNSGDERDVNHTLVTPQIGRPPARDRSGSPSQPAQPPTPPGARRPKRRRRWLRTLVGAVVLLLVCAGLVAGSWWYAAGRWGSIPDVSDQSVDQATTALQSQGYQVVVDPPRADEGVAKGDVVGTVPVTGARLVHGRVVHVVVSAGPTFYPVPMVGGKSRSAAKTALATLHTHGITVTYSQTSDDSVEQGRVVRTEPAAGAKIRRGTTVTVYISTGPPIVALPDVTTRTVDDATTTLTDLLFQVTRTDAFSDDVAAGEVISQSPAGSTQQRKFATVTLTVSKGPDLVTVPDVPRLDPLIDAQAKIRSAGLQPTVQASSFGAITNLVIQIKPSAGEHVKRGSTVTLTVI